VSFVGSSAVARKVYTTATQHGKRVQALGGAKNHAILMPDADPARVVDGLLNSAFNSAGQRCMAVSVAVMVGAAREKFMPLLQAATQKLRTGAAAEGNVDVPPVQSASQRERILSLIEHSVGEGARLLIDGRNVELAREFRDGYFVGPCIVDRVERSMRVYSEEVFGPVLVVLDCPSLDDAIRISNEHPLANGAVLFTSSGASAAQFEAQIQCGMPGVNVAVPSPVAYHSFGGWRSSLYGDLAMHGPDAINFFTRRQVLTSRWG
jgi:malonate-semialdehyde dehydrogenase (acetylating) / methylmalonate-semialdehyde dehydrogenase